MSKIQLELPGRMNTQINGSLNSYIRAAFWVLAGLMIVIGLVSYTVYFWRDGREICAGTASDCQLKLQYSQHEVTELEKSGVSFQAMLAFRFAALILGGMTALATGLLIASRRSDNWMALIIALFLISSGTVGNTGVTSALRRAVPALEIPLTLLSPVYIILIYLGLGLFPNGHPVPRWMGWVLPLCCILESIVEWLPASALDLARLLSVIFILPSFGLLLFAQILRYRNYSNLLERQQTKWAVTGIVLYLAVILAGGLLAESKIFGDNQLVSEIIGTLSFNLLPGLLLAVFFSLAILRSRLWDIDVIIRKTLVWSALTVFLGLVYFGAVTLLQSIFTAVSGQQSAVAIVISTLAIAALFNPLRRRLQEFVNRRFYRRKYNAEQALASFSETARQEVDLEGLTEKLLSVVQETVQPEHASLWLAPASDPASKTPRGARQ